jgi:hypothetical protein
MEIKAVASELPDIHISMTNIEADALQSMLYEARSYASDCGESVEDHNTFIELLEEALGT